MLWAIIIAVAALLLFGSLLASVGKALGTLIWLLQSAYRLLTRSKDREETR